MAHTQVYSRYDNLLVTFVLPITNIGAGMTWSGLPYLLASETSDLSNIPVLFIASVTASALFTLIGGTVADHFQRKSVVIVCLIADASLTLALAGIGSANTIYLFYAVSFSSALIGSLNGSILGLWIKDILNATADNLARSLAQRGIWNISAKAIGFSIGPVIYKVLAFNALYVDALFSVIPIIALFWIHDPDRTNHGRVGWSGGYTEIAKRDFWTRERRLIISLYALTASYTVPTVIISYAVLLGRFGYDVVNASSFWLFASLGSVISHLGLAQRFADRLNSGTRLVVGQAIMAVGFIGLWVSDSISSFIAFFMVFTFSNPVITNSLETEVYEKCSDSFRGRFAALCYLSDDLAGLFVLTTFNLYGADERGDFFYLLSIPIMTFAILLIYSNRSYLNSHSEKQRAD
ncbi:MFS transporter [Aestuariivirga sp.]|uniref:MFS transporter n=1 Tax=Aestuariivirga sp. TaxID=2650926 RepID=UPI0039E51724